MNSYFGDAIFRKRFENKPIQKQAEKLLFNKKNKPRLIFEEIRYLLTLQIRDWIDVIIYTHMGSRKNAPEEKASETPDWNENVIPEEIKFAKLTTEKILPRKITPQKNTSDHLGNSIFSLMHYSMPIE